MNKKGVLEESSAIYNHKEYGSEKEKWQQMNGKQKFEHFNEYYRNKVIIVIIVIAVLSSFLYTIFKPKPDTVLSVAVLSDYWDGEKKAEFIKSASEAMGLENEKQVIEVDDSYYFNEETGEADYAVAQKLDVRIMAGETGVIIAGENKFKELINKGFFIKIDEIMSAEVLSSMGADVTDNGFGIVLKDNKRLKEAGSTRETSVLGVIVQQESRADYKYIISFINYLLQNP